MALAMIGSGAIVDAAVFSAKASDWGCEVILCLANPGSPTEYSACVPPIKKLYSHLAKGGSFPTCSGAGFSSSKPRYEPYECKAGYKLVRSSDVDGNFRATCQSETITRLPTHECLAGRDTPPRGQWHVIDGKRVCGIYEQVTPDRREKPNYIDVNIEGSGTKRIWY